MPGATSGLLAWVLAALPVVLLVGLVLRAEWGTGTTALLAAAAAIVVGAAAFRAGPEVLAVGVGKGVWTGVWILYVIWTALLLYEVTSQAGLDRLGDVFSSILPRGVENVLLIAWVFPSFVQGVAGFGTPIAVAAPLLIAMGIGPVRAVMLPLVGYHWSVTFGSMGSSFYMGALTADLSGAATDAFAAQAALLLGINLLAAGVAVACLHGGLDGLRRGARMIVGVGTAMVIVLNVAARIEPSIGSLAAGMAGLVAAGLLAVLTRREPRPDRDNRPDRDRAGRFAVAVRILLPYLLLLVAVLAVFLPAGSREFAKTELLVGPTFPATETGLGVTNARIGPYTPIALLGHPGTYILLSAAAGVVVYRLTALWPRRSLRAVLGRWFRSALGATVPVVALTVLATVMVDTGMVRTLARGAAAATGSLYPLVAPLVGALGTFTTGSTTTSNALFSALQSDVARLLGLTPTHLVAAQTAGANVGNAMAPVVIVVGTSAIGGRDGEGRILRRVVPTGIVLLAVTALSTGALVALG